MGVDHDSVCFLGWEIVPTVGADKEPDPRRNGSNEADAIEDIAEANGLKWGKYGSASYGGEGYYVVGVDLDGASLEDLSAAIAKLKACQLVAKHGPPSVVGGVHTW